MKLLRFEWRKLLGTRFLVILTGIFLLCNGLSCLVITGEGEVPREDAAALFEAYRRDPAAVISAYEERTLRQSEEEKRWLDAKRKRVVDYQRTVLPNTYAVGKEYTDEQLFYELFSRLEYIGGYPDRISQVLEDAQSILLQSPPNSYTARYQEQILMTYRPLLRQTSPGLEYTRGWDTFFMYEGSVVFTYLLLVFLSAAVFPKDAVLGMDQLLRSAKYGRRHTFTAKLTLVSLAAVLMTLLFQAESFLVIGLTEGYSSPHNTITAFEAFYACPVGWKLWEFLLFNLGQKILMSLLFAMVCSVITVVLTKITVVSGIHVMGECLCFVSQL